MSILITGAAGYIGSHVAKQLLENTTYHLIIIDNLSTGNRKTLEVLRKIRAFTFIKLDLNEFAKVNTLIKEYNIKTIFHFAASIVVSESVENPLKYYINNTVNTTNLIKCALKNGVEKFIFSSTAAVYGAPNDVPNIGIDENSLTNPINPYGMSKLMSEKILQDGAATNAHFKYIIFRYFNVSGADIHYVKEILTPRIGECHDPETHLIPVVIQTALQKRKNITIFGNDFSTDDGTCIRDYIHVDDLADAHIKAIDYLENNSSDIFNVGYGRGYSVKEVIQTIKNMSNNFEVKITARREGDPAVLIANNTKIKTKMHWLPKYDNLDLICKSALSWEKEKD